MWEVYPLFFVDWLFSCLYLVLIAIIVRRTAGGCGAMSRESPSAGHMGALGSKCKGSSRAVCAAVLCKRHEMLLHWACCYCKLYSMLHKSISTEQGIELMLGGHPGESYPVPPADSLVIFSWFYPSGQSLQTGNEQINIDAQHSVFSLWSEEQTVQQLHCVILGVSRQRLWF